MPGDRDRKIRRNVARRDQCVIAVAADPEERGEIAEVVIGIHCLMPEPGDELRDGHPVARTDLGQGLPEVVLDPDRGGDPVDAQRMRAALPLPGIGLDEEFAHRRASLPVDVRGSP